MKLLVDADFVVYKCCAGAESEIDFGDDVILVTSKFSEAMSAVKRDLNKIARNFFDSETILFFSDSTNFRKSINPSYKGHRNRKNALREEYEVIIMPTLEADDALGIYATKHPGNVICSPDKDMRQIPGQLFDMDKTMSVTKEEGERWHYIQTLAGDQTDGYAGVPGIGIKRAVTLFEEKGYTWETIVGAFTAKDLPVELALENARLAKILQCEDYDFEQQIPRLYTPASIS